MFFSRKIFSVPVGRSDVRMLSWIEGVGPKGAQRTVEQDECDGQLHLCNTGN